MIEKIKKYWFKILTLIIILPIIGVTANNYLGAVPKDLLLKVPEEKIKAYYENEKGEILYWYITEEKVGTTSIEKNGKVYQENMAKRQPQAKFYDLEGNKKAAEILLSGNTEFDQDTKEWKKLLVASTTKDAFDKQVDTGLISLLATPVYALSTTTKIIATSSNVWLSDNKATFALAHEAETGTLRGFEQDYLAQNMLHHSDLTTFYVRRASLYFPTHLIGAATVSSSSVYFRMDSTGGSDTDGYNIELQDLTNHSNFTKPGLAEDFNDFPSANVGSRDYTEMIDKNIWLAIKITDNNAVNTTGITNIGVRFSGDTASSTPTGGNAFRVYNGIGGSGLTYPYIEIEYTEIEPPIISDTCNYTGSGNFVVDAGDNCTCTTTTYVVGDFDLIASSTASSNDYHVMCNLGADNINMSKGVNIHLDDTANLELY